jgi:outer membrane immunogenic protein
MKRVLLSAVGFVALGLAGSAGAADLAPAPAPAPVYRAPVVAAPLYNWSGFYIGAHVGGGWAGNQSTEIAPGTAAFPVGTVFTKNNLSGVLGGVQGGFNWQVSSFVVGVEGEYSWADINGSATTNSVVLPAFSSTATANVRDLALATARAGFAADNWLFYVKGGGAWGHDNSNGASTAGWVVGGGVEWGFLPNWSAKLEYNHVDFGSKNVTVIGTATGTSFVSSSQTLDIVKAGVNYRFNWGGPVVARY